MRVNKTKMKVKTKEFYGANLMEISVGTNCPQGGDAGHGGRTYLRIRNLGGTAWSFRIVGNEVFRDASTGDVLCVEPSGVDIVLGGDSECRTFLACLKYAVAVLENQLGDDVLELEGEEKEEITQAELIS